MVRRLTASVRLEDFHGALSASTAEALEARIEERRAQHAAQRSARSDEIADELE